MQEFTAVVLAAGRGKRMKRSSPKVLCELSGRPLIYYVLSELLKLKKQVKQIIVVVGYKGSQVEKAIKRDFNKEFKGSTKINLVRQEKMLGTADAVKTARKKIKHSNVLVLCGDAPLVTSKVLAPFLFFFLRKKLSSCVLTADMGEKNSLGSIVRDKDGKIMAIREKLSSANTEKGIMHPEVNSGIYCFKKKVLLKSLPKIRINKKKREYFLTDTIEVLYKNNEKQGAYFLDDSDYILGINSPRDLFKAQKVLQLRLIEEFAQKGVEFIDPFTTYIQEGVKIGKNTIIYPFTYIEKGVIIGNNCALGPFIRLREGTVIEDNTQAGNFLEINRTKIGKDVRIKHFGYLGDAFVEDSANIGAGVVVANFDGKSKNKTYIKKGAFVGSDTVLIAPVTIGKEAVTGAGSVVTKNVKQKSVVAGVPAKPLKKKKRG